MKAESILGMDEQDSYYLNILRENQGFDEPAEWLAYAKAHGFRKIRAERLGRCPDCGEERFSVLGQYIYYSTLFRLKTCLGCSLIYADIRLDETVVKEHFETAYKDEDYFAERRRAVFEQITDLVSREAKPSGAVLDIGGAKGHLLSMLGEAREDLCLVLNDLSDAACSEAVSRFGLKAICCPVAGLESRGESYDWVLLIDVIYYEPDISGLWRTLQHIAGDEARIILRLPNKLCLVKFSQFLARLWPWRRRGLESRIRFYNPEHLYVFPRSYLKQRLADLGFERIRFMPSRLLQSTAEKGVAKRFFFLLARIFWIFSFGVLVITPSQLIVARKQ